MKQIKWFVIFGNLLFVLFFFNYSVIKKEMTLKKGKLVLLKLAPVDPRSLMQGDYMSLRYDIGQSMWKYNDSLEYKGYCIVKLDSNNVAERVRFQSGKKPLNEGELLIKYRKRKWDISIGAESYFFQEGTAEKYEKAKYGAVKVDKNGNSILIGLYDENIKFIEP